MAEPASFAGLPQCLARGRREIRPMPASQANPPVAPMPPAGYPAAPPGRPN